MGGNAPKCVVFLPPYSLCQPAAELHFIFEAALASEHTDLQQMHVAVVASSLNIYMNY